MAGRRQERALVKAGQLQASRRGVPKQGIEEVVALGASPYGVDECWPTAAVICRQVEPSRCARTTMEARLAASDSKEAFGETPDTEARAGRVRRCWSESA